VHTYMLLLYVTAGRERGGKVGKIGKVGSLNRENTFCIFFIFFLPVTRSVR
jgi:hypothetical protein